MTSTTTAETLVPLESNPTAFNEFLTRLGVQNPRMQFTDVFGVSEELLDMVPQPVKAVVFVYPITKATSEYTDDLSSAQKAEVTEFMKDNSTLFFTTQTVANMCGTIAVLHAVMNNLDEIGTLSNDGCLKHFIAKTANQTPDVCAKVIAEEKNLVDMHSEIATLPDNDTRDINVATNLHFVCFVRAGGRCVELDGRLPAPLLHEACEPGRSFLDASARVIQARMNLIPELYEFSIMALCGPDASA